MLLPSFAIALLSSLSAAAGGIPFVNPATQGGSFLSNAGNGLGEPLNIVISGTSSADVLTDSGFLSYARAVGFTADCLNLPSAHPFTANLGDGRGAQPLLAEIRESFGNVVLGSCIEVLLGGNHFRVYRQKGPQADTGALFLGTSTERGLLQNHTIAPNGYDIGRDNFVRMALGTTVFDGVSYNTTAQTLTGVLPIGSEGVNHGISIDGNAVLLTVTIV